MENLPFPDRRRQQDRRARPTAPLTLKGFIGRRKHIRRKEDQLNNPLCRYLQPAFGADGCIHHSPIPQRCFFHLEAGQFGRVGTQSRHALFLTFGPLPFLIAKLLLTVVCVVVFLIHKNRLIFSGRVSVKAILVAVLSLYFLLILYELTLLLRMEYMLLEAGNYSGIGGTPFSNSLTASSRVS